MISPLQNINRSVPTGRSLKGKVAVVTGAGQGNGKAIAKRLATEGASIFVTDIQMDLLNLVEAELKSTGATVSSGIYDASKAAEAQRLIIDVVDRFKRLDIMVNNAGAIKPQPFLEVTEEVWDWSIDLNLKGVYFHMQEAAKFMITQGSGTIINIASVAGIAGGMTLSPPYAASKAAVINLTKVAASKMAEHGITVNSVAPGIVDTAFNWSIDSEIGVKQLNMDPGEQLAERADPVPLGRISQPEDVSNVVAFLASPDASYITGETIVVSGGLVMR